MFRKSKYSNKLWWLDNPHASSLTYSRCSLVRDRFCSLVHISLQRIPYGVKWMKWIISYQVNLSIYALQLTFEFSCNHEWSFMFYLLKLFIQVRSMLKFCQYLNKTQQFKTTGHLSFYSKESYLVLRFKLLPSEVKISWGGSFHKFSKSRNMLKRKFAKCCYIMGQKK